MLDSAKREQKNFSRNESEQRGKLEDRRDNLLRAGAAVAASGTLASPAATITATKAGYVLSPLATTVLCNAPLLAFALVQMSGISPIQHILREKQTLNYSPFPFDGYNNNNNNNNKKRGGVDGEPFGTVQQVVKDKCTESMPFAISLAMTLNGFSWFGYGWMVTGDPFVYVPNALGFLSGVVQLSLFAIYPNKRIPPPLPNTPKA
ncbi:hypothetical protein RFI_13977 [Reticulomyxa filosa]|uniref:Sugar transporter SWEET1 n=1 Tax=Reticulomyxa filosa TaxID=46433 RepID=X6NBD4_RETFI|nr:hypothetical protein RFI_13977 [Reticulomyxa filosa]|eukprot:ETO23208.1 hypothetical protein RFI_13977 [Reticulomyxa filosa]